MKNFKDFELTNEQQKNTIGKGKPEWAGVPAHMRNSNNPDYVDGDGNPYPSWGEHDKDSGLEYENPYDTGDAED